MLKFKKEHPYLICIDSDGTVIDSMTIKHERCFGPKFIEVFNINKHKDEVLSYWLDINLYEKTRGINRFQGLNKAIKYLEKYEIYIDGYDVFENWVNTTKAFSNDLLKEEISKNENNYCLKKALEWSLEVNKAIKELPLSSPFENVKEALEILSKYCDLVGVSSANKEAVNEEWSHHDLFKYFKAVGCQDVGSKTKIIEDVLKLGYELNDSYMVGDALGDFEASQKNNIRFIPIIPTKEVESWIKIKDVILNKITNNSFDNEFQEELNKEFFDSLK